MTDTTSNIRSVQCLAELKALKEEYGYGIFDAAIRQMGRKRLQIDKNSRESRQRFRPRDYKRAYHRQRGICPICRLGMILPLTFPGGLAMDHIDPNRADFNHPSNLQVTHEICNKRKAAKSIQEQSKSSGRPFVDIIRVPVDEDREHIEDISDEKPAFLRKIMD
jgi:hypothetical protein